MNLVSESVAKHKIKFQNMPLQELRVLLEKDLTRQGYSSFLTNVTENDLALKVMKSSDKPTIVSISRERHRPLELDVTVNHNLLNSYDLVTKRGKEKNSGNRQSSFMMYRWLWIGLILFGVIISLIITFVNVLIALIESATPGWTSIQRSAGIIFVAFLGFLWYVYIRPKLELSDNRRRNQSDRYLLEQIKVFIEGIAYQAPSNTIVRCWNCFEEITQSENFCSSCGKQQN